MGAQPSELASVAAAEHQPLSQSLAALLAEAGAERLTLNRLLLRTQGRGLYLVIIILCLPFVVPFSIPGLSPLMGTIITLLTLRLAFGKEPRLPAFLGERPLPAGFQQRVLRGGVTFLRQVERVVRPRRTTWLSWPAVRVANCICVIVLALLLALPLPAPPFFLTNSIPSYGIILLAAAMMEEDGVLIWFGYAALVFNLVFFGLIGGAVWQLILKGWHLLSHASGQ